ncbi:uncharacterized protein METZ01_LOCUS453515, partial [marine metagenome]
MYIYINKETIMKKIFLLLLPLLLIVSCETDEEDASLVGTWNIQS